MNERPAVDRLREAMRNASVDDLDVAIEAAEELGRQAVAVAIAIEPPEPPAAPREDPEQRQRQLDAALGDAIEIASRHRQRLGRRVCSSSDARVTRQIYELLRAMAGPDGGADNDPSFQ
jgi:sugar phosphate isomerase/epimerase